MKTSKLHFSLIAIFMSLGIFAYGESQLISRIPTNGAGKQIVSIHSFSDQTKPTEGAVNLLLPDMATNEDKWCDVNSAEPWVVFELSNIYTLDKFVITDAQIREADNGNVAEYKLFVSNIPYDEIIGGWEDSDWTEVAHKTEDGEVIIKEIILDTPVEARFVKFLILDKGVRKDNGNPENAIRIYGFDIYGTYASEIDRGNLISVGKTILATEDAVSKRESGINIIDGNKTNKFDKWCFGSYGNDINQRYTIIDLEAQYDLSQIKVYDANFLESGTVNMQGCNIYVSRYAPDLSLINMYDADLNECWTQVVNSDFEDTEDIKDYPLTDVSGRFVKVEIPYLKAGDPTQSSRIFEVEIFGTEALVADDDATLSLLSVSKGSLNPKFTGDVTSYTVNVDKEVESLILAASATSKNATLTGAGEKALAFGENTFEVVVLAEDKSNTLTYTVVVNRAAQSKISTLDTLSCSVGFFTPAFNADSLNYFVDVPMGTENVTISALTTQEDAQISGIGEQALVAGQDNIFNVVVTAEDGVASKTYTITVHIEAENLISVNYGLSTGKRIVNIHSCSGMANGTENPYKLLIGERLNTNGDTGNKWCENNTDQPWVILSLSDIYEINRIVIRDANLIEPDAVNVSYYTIAVSTTGVYPDDFFTIDENFTEVGQNVIDIDYLADNAKFIKLTFDKGLDEEGAIANAVWIYGVDIYGTLAEEVDYNNVVSVGKTIVEASSFAGDRETPCNLLDGNVNYEVEDPMTYEISKHNCDPWAFNVQNGDGMVIIDLEDVYSVDSFKLYDTNDWIKGYKVSVNTTGNDNDWTEVFSGTFTPDTIEVENDIFELDTVAVHVDPKIAILDAPVNARFVKLELPVAMQSDNWNRIREFEVYSNGLASGLRSIASDKNNTLVVYPNPISQGNDLYLNETGNLKIFNLQGLVVVDKEVSGSTSISTKSLESGSYIFQLMNENGSRQAKLVVK